MPLSTSLGLGPDEWTAVLLSLRIAALATLAGLPVAVAVAYLLARFEFPGKVILDGIIHLPLVLPPVVTGYLLLLAFGRRGFIGSFLAETFGIVLAFRWTGAVLAAAVMGFPLMVRAIRLSFEAIDPRLEAASRTLGAPPLASFFRVSLPLALPGILVGSVLAYAKALGEFGATITFVSNIPGETRTIAAHIYTLPQTPNGDLMALRLTVVSIGLALVALAASEFLQRRARIRMGTDA
jgi:molybdate transport system permease protein